MLDLTKNVLKKLFFLILMIDLLGNEVFCASKKTKKKSKKTEQKTEVQQEQENKENIDLIKKLLMGRL